MSSNRPPHLNEIVGRAELPNLLDANAVPTVIDTTSTSTGAVQRNLWPGYPIRVELGPSRAVVEVGLVEPEPGVFAIAVDTDESSASVLLDAPAHLAADRWEVDERKLVHFVAGVLRIGAQSVAAIIGPEEVASEPSVPNTGLDELKRQEAIGAIAEAMAHNIRAPGKRGDQVQGTLTRALRALGVPEGELPRG